MKLRMSCVPVVWQRVGLSSELHSYWFSFCYHLPETSVRIPSQLLMVYSFRSWFLSNNICIKSTGGKPMDENLRIFPSTSFHLLSVQTFNILCFCPQNHCKLHREKISQFSASHHSELSLPYDMGLFVYFIHKQMQKPSAAVLASF